MDPFGVYSTTSPVSGTTFSASPSTGIPSASGSAWSASCVAPSAFDVGGSIQDL